MFISSIIFFVVLNYKLIITFLAGFFLWLFFKICWRFGWAGISPIR